MFNKVNFNLSNNMKYLIPKRIQPSDFEILESNTTFKIKNINNPIHLFGIPLLPPRAGMKAVIVFIN